MGSTPVGPATITPIKKNIMTSTTNDSVPIKFIDNLLPKAIINIIRLIDNMEDLSNPGELKEFHRCIVEQRDFDYAILKAYKRTAAPRTLRAAQLPGKDNEYNEYTLRLESSGTDNELFNTLLKEVANRLATDTHSLHKAWLINKNGDVQKILPQEIAVTYKLIEAGVG